MTGKNAERELTQLLAIADNSTGQAHAFRTGYGKIGLSSKDGSRNVSPLMTRPKMIDWLNAYIDGANARDRTALAKEDAARNGAKARFSATLAAIIGHPLPAPAPIDTETADGWRNKETRTFHRWITNDQDAYAVALAQARETIAFLDEDPTTAARSVDLVAHLEDSLRDAWRADADTFCDRAEANPIFADLLFAALGRVDWQAIAEDLLTRAYEPTRADAPDLSPRPPAPEQE